MQRLIALLLALSLLFGLAGCALQIDHDQPEDTGRSEQVLQDSTQAAEDTASGEDALPTDPTDSTGEDTEPTTQLTDPTEDTEPAPKPTESTQKPTETQATVPTVAPTEPTVVPTEPTVAPTEPTVAPTEPTVAPTEPTEAPTEPTEAPTEPTEAPTEPTEEPTEPDDPVVLIDEDGWYYSAEDVGLYLHVYGHLPSNYITKSEAKALGWKSGSVERYKTGGAIGGDKFGNREGLLPKASGRQYYECDIDTNGRSSRGSKRIVYSNDGLIYYTADHYESFTLLYSKEDP